MHASVYGLLEGARLVSVLDRKREKAQKFANDFSAQPFGDFDDFLASSDLDVVDICLPTHLHREFTVKALEAGKHVLCEKPMALTVEDADAMIAASKASGKQLMIGHCIRFWPEYALLKKYADDGRFGRLLSINLTRYGEFPHWSTDNWLADESLAGGGVLDMHIHDTDFMLYLLGEPTSTHSWGTIDERGASHAFTTMVYPGCVAHLEGGWNLPSHTPFKMAFRAIFERGGMIMDAGPLTVYEPGKEPVIPEFPRMEAQGGGNISDLGGYYHEVKYFVDCLRDGRAVEIVTPETSRASLHYTLEEIRQIKA